jgi:hypothetical protein
MWPLCSMLFASAVLLLVALLHFDSSALRCVLHCDTAVPSPGSEIPLPLWSIRTRWFSMAVSCNGHWSLPHVGSAWLSRVARQRSLCLLVNENVFCRNLFYRLVAQLRSLCCYLTAGPPLRSACYRFLLCIPSECGYQATAGPSASVFIGDDTRQHLCRPPPPPH